MEEEKTCFALCWRTGKVHRKLDFTKYRGELHRHKQGHKYFESAKQDSILCGTMSRQCHKIDLFEIARVSIASRASELLGKVIDFGVRTALEY